MEDTTLAQHKRLLQPDLHSFMNVTLTIEGEKEKVYTLRNVIEKRLPSLFNTDALIKKKREKKGDAGIMTIDYKSTAFSLTVLHQVLEWCYTDTVDFESMEIPEVMLLIRAATKLQAERLHFLCERVLRSRMTVQSVFTILKESKRLEIDDIKDLGTSFAHQNWSQFCADKPGMEIIGIELFQELTVAMQFYKPENKKDLSVEALKVVPSTVVADFKAILEEAKYADGDFIFPNPDVAENIKFNCAIVAAHTKPLFQLMSSNKSKQFIIEGLSYRSTKDLLEYIYFGDVNFDAIGACKLIEYTINQYALQHVLGDCITSIFSGITDKSALDILRVTYLPNFQTATMQELREKVLEHICRDFKDIDIPVVRSVKPKDIAFEMLADILDSIHQSPSKVVSARGPGGIAHESSVDKLEKPPLVSSESSKRLKGRKKKTKSVTKEKSESKKRDKKK